MQSTRYAVTSCHGNDDETWSTSCLITSYSYANATSKSELQLILNYMSTNISHLMRSRRISIVQF